MRPVPTAAGYVYCPRCGRTVHAHGFPPGQVHADCRGAPRGPRSAVAWLLGVSGLAALLAARRERRYLARRRRCAGGRCRA